MEFLVTIVVRICRTLTNRRLTPTAVRLVHRRSSDASEFESFVGCRIDFGEDADEIVFDRQARQLPVVGADPYLNEMLVRYCEEALSHRRANTSSLRTAIENAITPLLPHGKAQIDIVARELGISRRTLARKLAADGLTFDEILDQLRSDLAARYLGRGQPGNRADRLARRLSWGQRLHPCLQALDRNDAWANQGRLSRLT